MKGIVPAGANEAWAREMTQRLRNRAVVQLDILRDRLVAQCLAEDGGVSSADRLAVAEHLVRSTPLEAASKGKKQPVVSIAMRFHQG